MRAIRVRVDQFPRHESLGLTNSRYSNDDEEPLHGLGVVAEVIAKQLMSSDLLTRRDYLELVLALLEEPSPEGVYICCFCQAGNLLVQWRGYGANGTGVCITFDPVGFGFITGRDSPRIAPALVRLLRARPAAPHRASQRSTSRTPTSAKSRSCA